jgi:hypothetical protein
MSSGQMSSEQMSFWANVFLGKCRLGKCHHGQTSYGQMSLGKCRLGKCHGTKLLNDIGELGFTKRRPSADDMPLQRRAALDSHWGDLAFI